MSPPWTNDSFEHLFRSTAPRVRSYLLRHVGPDDADDALAETFVVAWRRLDQVPEHALPWLLVVAHNMARHTWRSRRRADALWSAAVRDQWRESVALSPERAVLDREEAIAALDELTAFEREALLLTAWDGLDHTDAARVAGCSTRAFTVRLSRARARFDRLLAPDPPNASSTSVLASLLEQS